MAQDVNPDTAPAPENSAPENPAPESSASRTPSAKTPPIRMLGDRLLVRLDDDAAERRSAAGIVIPATAVVGRKLAWGKVAAIGHSVRQVTVGDTVLFDPDDRGEVELEGIAYVLLREKELHAVARPEASGEGTGLYL